MVGCRTHRWEFRVELVRGDDTRHETLVVTEQGETTRRDADDGVQQGVAVEAAVLDERAVGGGAALLAGEGGHGGVSGGVAMEGEVIHEVGCG